MKISNNIVTNCSDFVWSLNISDLKQFKEILKTIEQVMNWKVYAQLGFIDKKVYVPADINQIEIIKYKDGDNEYEELGISMMNLLTNINPKINKDNFEQSEIWKKYQGLITSAYLGDTEYISLRLAQINHLPNEDGVHVFEGISAWSTIRDFYIAYTDGYCDDRFIITENQPQHDQLRFIGDLIRKLGGSFHHEDGGYSQEDDHEQWFRENGYEDIL